MDERVLDQDAANLQSALLVTEGTRLAAVFDGQPMATRERHRAELVRKNICESREVDELLLDRHPPGVEAGKVKEVRRELRETRDLLPHRDHELRLRGRVEILVVHELEEAAEREQRRAELVGGVGDELAAGVLELRQSLAHVVEGDGQLTELVLAAIDYGLAEVARGDAVRRALEPSDAPGEERREEIADGERGQQRDQPRDQKAAADLVDALKRVPQRSADEDDWAAL